nr:hypothetical protein Iba_chr05fCG3390 [Ipomoea batatas]
MRSIFDKASCICRNLILADITFRVVLLFVARFVVRAIIRHRKLIVRNGNVASMASEAFGMPDSSHTA